MFLSVQSSLCFLCILMFLDRIEAPKSSTSSTSTSFERGTEGYMKLLRYMEAQMVRDTPQALKSEDARALELELGNIQFQLELAEFPRHSLSSSRSSISSTSRASSTSRTSSTSRASSTEAELSLSAMERLDVEDLSTVLLTTFSSSEFPVPISFCTHDECARRRSSSGLPLDAPGLGHRRSSSSGLPPALTLGSPRFKKCHPRSPDTRPRDVVVVLLEELKSKAKGDEFIYRELEKSEEEFFCRLGGFELHATVDDDTYAIRIPLYVAYSGDPYQWFFYALPHDFYKEVKERRRHPALVALLAEEGVPVPDHELESNMDLKTIDLAMYSVYDDGGAEIVVNVSPYGDDKTATIKNIHWKKGMTPEFTVTKREPKKVASTKKGLLGALFDYKIPLHETRMKFAIRNVRWSAPFSKALDTLWTKLGVTLLTCSDQAYIPCGDQNQPGNAAIAMLFLRIFGKQEVHEMSSYYMKEPFDFDIGEDNREFDDLGHITKRDQFDEIAIRLHTTPFGDVMSELEVAGRHYHERLYRRGQIQYGAKRKQIEDSKQLRLDVTELELELKAQEAALKELYQSSDEGYYKGHPGDRWEDARAPAAWYQEIINLRDMVARQNELNKDQEYRRVKQFKDDDLAYVSMGDVMTMLWYRGKHKQCEKYMEVFEFIYGRFNPDIGTTAMTHDTPYGRLMHTARKAVQDLVKRLPIDDAARLSVSHDVPKPSLFRYLQPMVMILCICALPCVYGLYCCFTKAGEYGVTKDKEPYQYDPVDNNELGQS
eukprot:418937_1